MTSQTDSAEGARCTSVARLLGAHLDGQLDAAKTLEVDDHLGACGDCRERVALDRAIRGSLKKTTKSATPDDVRARMLAAMAGQTARLEKPSAAPAARPSMLRHWRTMLPMASAAAMALAWGAAGRLPMAMSDVTTARAGFDNDQLVNQFVDVHSRPLRPETPDPKMVRGFEREVGVPVHVPQFERNTHFVGGRLLPIQGGERVSMLQYEVVNKNGAVQRASLFIYDPHKIQISGSDLSPRAVGTAQVRVGQARGYSVAVAQHGAVGYAVASEDAELSAELVAAAGN